MTDGRHYAVNCVFPPTWLADAAVRSRMVPSALRNTADKIEGIPRDRPWRIGNIRYGAFIVPHDLTRSGLTRFRRTPMLDPGVFATVFAGLYVAHGVADHWLQTSEQARDKSLPGWKGRAACASHVLPYVALAALFVVGLQYLFGLPLHWYWIGAGLVVSGATHYWADRRTTLARLCERLGKGEFYRLGAPREVAAWTEHDEQLVTLEVRGNDPAGWDNPSLGTGAYALDQWWHIFWTFAAALVMVIS